MSEFLASFLSVKRGVGVGAGARVGVYLFFFKECGFRVRAKVRVDNNTNPNPNPTLENSVILKKDRPRPRGLLTPNLSTFRWDYILETIAITYPNFLSRFSSCSRNISSYVLPKCKRISLNFRAFKSRRKIENTIMTQTNLSCDNSWCACGYVFCLKIKITKVCNHD